MSSFVRKLIVLPALTLSLSSTVSAQTLFTCDGRGVSKEDFLKAYNKNSNEGKATQKSYREYLDLYIRYKLKVRAAYDMQLDTLASQRTELQNFRMQVAESYLKDEESQNKLIKEVYVRGQKDLRVAHIFIALPKNASPADTLNTYDRAWTAYNELKRGKKFSEVAQSFSDDPSVKRNNGDIGYITVFTLPYELESVVYSTPTGKFSQPFRTKSGYHIFKVETERKSLGRIKVAQILVGLPPNATDANRETARLKADSIYAALKNGADFATTAHAVSGDNLTFQNGGQLPEFGIGKYDSLFEATAFGLDHDSAISRPVASRFGYHILKRIYRKPFPHEWDKEAEATLKNQVTNDPRIAVSRKALLDKIYKQTNFTPENLPATKLWAFTDSAVLNRPLPAYTDLTINTVVFYFGGQPYLVKDWVEYARPMKTGRAATLNRQDPDIFIQFREKTALEYYRNHLEEYNRDFAFQLNEFKEGNLLFEVMQRKVWDKASTDSAGLRNYYEGHKDKYWWNASVDAFLFTCNNEKTATRLRAELEGNIYHWRSLTDSLGAGVQADSGRYEQSQIPLAEKTAFSPGTFTPFLTNKTDNSVSFSYIQNVYNDRAPRSYKDARGFVINDYQLWLEDQWIGELKKKYPVVVDEAVFNSLTK